MYVLGETSRQTHIKILFLENGFESEYYPEEREPVGKLLSHLAFKKDVWSQREGMESETIMWDSRRIPTQWSPLPPGKACSARSFRMLA